jgi:hypothetical protein
MAACKKPMTYEEKELAILREAVDKAEERSGRKAVEAPQMKQMINILEGFLRRKKLVCYGGTAINNILPLDSQFYNREVEIPDYDFFSPSAMTDAKELADIYAKEGFSDVEAKAGVHHGTYKVFVNFVPIADITYLTPSLFKAISRDAITVNGIKYAPPNYLRMAMYLELSRPDGDVSRWEKVLKRLTLLNKHYPMRNPRCNADSFVRDFEGDEHDEATIYSIVRDSIADQGLVFFGGYAVTLYARYMPAKLRQQVAEIPDFDALAEDPKTAATIIQERLEYHGIKDVRIYKKPGIGEIIAPHYEVAVGDDSVAVLYEPLACHSYNTLKLHGKIYKIATVDTMLSFYLAFLYADRSYYDEERLVCMAQYLFEVQSRNRLEQKGLLRRFSISCYGHQETLEEIRAHKTKMHEELKRGTKEYDEWFLRYVPTQDKTARRKAIRKDKKTRGKKKAKVDPKKKRQTRRKK